jgi:IS1 family transposase
MGDDHQTMGDVWTFCSLDPDSKAVPSFKCGKRDLLTTHAFIDDLASRLNNRIQLSSDAMVSYAEAVERSFGSEIDYGQIVKSYEVAEKTPQRRYSPTKLVNVAKHRIVGNPKPGLVSTSYVERLNGTTRHHMRRLTRLTLAFSKKFENFEAAVGLHFFYYNFIKSHKSLKGATPGMAIGVERSFLKVDDIVEAMNG